jgi:branched-chain amino acid transport system substrate-binding protein
MKQTIGLTALAVMLACGTANAQQVNVKIGVLTDMSSLYADIGRPAPSP